MNKIACYLSLLLIFPMASAAELPQAIPVSPTVASEANTQVTAQPITITIKKTWSVDEARKEALENAHQSIDTTNFPKIDPNFRENKLAIENQAYTTEHKFITVFKRGYTVTERCSLYSFDYWYDGTLKGIDVNSSPSYPNQTLCPSTHPSKTYKYAYPQGNLVGIGIRLAEHDVFGFKPDGTFLIHWVNSQCFFADGSSCGIRKSF